MVLLELVSSLAAPVADKTQWFALSRNYLDTLMLQ